MSREYIDFYGYKKDSYEKLTNDFMEVIRDHEPVKRDGIVDRDFRLERVVYVKNIYGLSDKELEEKIDYHMLKKGYQRYTDYNYYVHHEKEFEEYYARQKIKNDTK